MAEAEAGVSTVAAAVVSMPVALVDFTAVDFTAVDSTAGDLAGFTAAVSMAASPACTMVSGTRTAATGTTAGTAGATAGGGGLEGLWWTYYTDPWGGYPDYGNYDYNQSNASQYWYYCSDPAGYYPYVPQCNTAWQTVP